MLVNQDTDYGKYRIQSYTLLDDQACVKINEITYTESVLIYDNDLTLWRPQSFSDLKITDFEIFYKKPPKILLLGTGSQLYIPDMALLRPLFESGIGVEFMNSAAACRTYNVLSSENREAALALLVI